MGTGTSLQMSPPVHRSIPLLQSSDCRLPLMWDHRMYTHLVRVTLHHSFGLCTCTSLSSIQALQHKSDSNGCSVEHCNSVWLWCVAMCCFFTRGFFPGRQSAPKYIDILTYSQFALAQHRQLLYTCICTCVYMCTCICLLR